MKKGPFKMKKFSGFGDSPAKQKTPKRLPKSLVLGQSYKGFSDAEWARFEKAHEAANRAELKKVGRVAGRALGAAGVAATMYDMYKSGQKHSGGKAVKGQKTGIIKPSKSIYNKPKKSIYKK